MSIDSSTLDGVMRVKPLSITDGHINANAQIARTKLALDSLKSYQQNLLTARVWDALQTNLPGTGAADDLEIYSGTFGTNSMAIRTGDFKTTTITRRCRMQIPIPMEYEAGEDINIRLHAGMMTTVADGSCTIDVEAYKSDEDAGLGSDLVTTAATTINSLTSADKDFVVDGATLSPGDWLDVRITIAGVDTATGTAVIGQFGSVQLLVDVRG